MVEFLMAMLMVVGCSIGAVILMILLYLFIGLVEIIINKIGSKGDDE